MNAPKLISFITTDYCTASCNNCYQLLPAYKEILAENIVKKIKEKDPNIIERIKESNLLEFIKTNLV